MPIFYVYLNWFPEQSPNNAGLGRHLLTCESRYVANEFFRALQSTMYYGKKRFTRLERNTPQLWYYDSIDLNAWNTVLALLRSTAFLEFAPKVMTQLLYDASGRDWPVIPIVDGPDWVNNGTYFIRNKRQPDLYWYHDNGYIRVSRDQKTKFRIRGIAFAESDRTILIRSDQVQLSLLGKVEKNRKYLSKASGSMKTTLSAYDSTRLKFGDFIDGFGVTFEGNSSSIPGHGFVTWAKDDDGDEWEFC